MSDGGRLYGTEFVALNNSGVSGSALVVQDGNSITVSIKAEGLEAGQMHAQHIHGIRGVEKGMTATPTIRQDVDGDGFVELAEGLATYGPVLLNLATDPDAAAELPIGGMAHGGIAFPTAGEDGKLNYLETFTFDTEGEANAAAAMLFDELTPLNIREIVLHGQTLDEGQGQAGGPAPDEADGTAGYKALLPVASGELTDIETNAELMRFGSHFNADEHFTPGIALLEDARSEDAPSTSGEADHASQNVLGEILEGMSESAEVYGTKFTALNNSGVSGSALVVQDGNSITVSIKAEGLEAGQMHAQHIHGIRGVEKGMTATPTIRQDVDGDGFVELAEGLATYGPVLLNLATDPDAAAELPIGGMAHGGIAFPTAGEDGKLHYLETFTFDTEGEANAAAAMLFDELTPLNIREIVLHGQTLDEGQGQAGSPAPDEADGTAGYKALLPVASGELTDIETNADLLAFSSHFHNHGESIFIA
ncbi:hypothetical protein [Azospirillum sp. SYSU D00513]|uniref:hypothetical protein n=2 Tax=Pseudomonadati TaxID=3379134 RepID=UPI001A967344|nr:hypothetical protein [Azospirillum sp. SYSU D00513]